MAFTLSSMCFCFVIKFFVTTFLAGMAKLNLPAEEAYHRRFAAAQRINIVAWCAFPVAWLIRFINPALADLAMDFCDLGVKLCVAVLFNFADVG